MSSWIDAKYYNQALHDRDDARHERDVALHEAARLREALVQIRDRTQRHDLHGNPLAGAVFMIAREALAEPL